MSESENPADFRPGEPVLVCRWRLQAKELVFKSRHLKALKARRVRGEALAAPLVGWVSQHIEWTLTQGAYDDPHGTLMLVVDAKGQAAMSVGLYEALSSEARSVECLVERAATAEQEAEATRVASEVLWCALSGDERETAGESGTSSMSRLICGLAADAPRSAAASFVYDLALAKGWQVDFDPEFLGRAQAGELSAGEHAGLFLSSDEHGVVLPAEPELATEASHPAEFFSAAYQALLGKMRERNQGRNRV